MSNDTNELKVIVAHVVSAKMDKTAVVRIVRKVRHKLYNKYIKRFTKIFVHDEENVCNEGDLIAITECHPISRHKSWRLVKVVESASSH
jgi:small subunit ribosomal protein S17